MLEKLQKQADLPELVLAAHDLFLQLNGNPYSIFTAAAFYKNPFSDYDLVTIYKQIVSTEIHKK